MKQKRAEDLERITSPYGIQLRVNRSIQAEGSLCTAEKKKKSQAFFKEGLGKYA